MKISKEYSEEEGDKNYDVNQAILIRILMNYMQIISLVGDIPITWPNLLKKFLDFNNKFASATEEYFSIDCFFAMNHEKVNIRPVFLKLLITTLAPFALSLIALIFWVVFYLIKKRKIRGNPNFKNSVITTVVIICFNM